MKLLKNIIFCLSIIFLFVVFNSCKKNNDTEPEKEVSIISGTGVFILNEGNFQWGNASISYYKYSDESVTTDVFSYANDRPLGDVAQSLCIYDNKLYIVVNNSGKVEVINPADFKSIATITGLTSPRYFLGINSSKAYISDMWSGSIYVIDINNYTKINSIKCNGNTEEMILHNDKVYVSNTTNEYIYIIDTSIDEIIDSIKTVYAPNSMVIDKNNFLWVISMGNYSPEIFGSLQKINLSNNNNELILNFDIPLNIWNKIKINKSLDTLYFLNNDIFRMSVNENTLPAQAFIEHGNKNFYGFGIDNNTNNIFVSDAIDYVQKGDVMIYSHNGSFLKSFKAGIIPSSFLFY